jgi:hypothetical protein
MGSIRSAGESVDPVLATGCLFSMAIRATGSPSALCAPRGLLYSRRVSEDAARRYYRSLVGRWSGIFSFTVTAPAILVGLGREARVTSLLARLASPTRMSTTLEASGDQFLHTTCVSKWGATAFRTRERMILHGGGRTLRLAGEQRWRLLRAVPYEAEGEVDATGTHATYRIPWCGVPMVQRMAIVPGGLELSQETGWSRGFVLLRRGG